MTLDHHTGGEYISVEIDHPLAIPPEGTLTLQLFIEEIDIILVVIGNLGIRDGDGLRALKAKPLYLLDDPVFAANEDGVTISGVPKRKSCADHPLLLSLGKDDTFPVGGNPVIDYL